VCTLDIIDTSILVDAQRREPGPNQSFQGKQAPDVFSEISKPGYNIFQPSSDIGWVRRDALPCDFWTELSSTVEKSNPKLDGSGFV